MYRFWDLYLEPLVAASGARVVCEVGAQYGRLTEPLLEHCVRAGAVGHIVDPEPQFPVQEFEERFGTAFVLHRAKSLNALERMPLPDVVLIDGDHNWYTVISELRLLERRAGAEDGRLPVVAFHDVGWPYGRRDLYYDPEAIPPGYRQPYARRAVHPDTGELGDEGINAHLDNAVYEHSVRNGVLTAIEDFLAESDASWRFETLPGFHGLGVLAEVGRLERQPRLAAAFDRLRDPDALRDHAAALERARIDTDIARVRNQALRDVAATDLQAARAELDEVNRRLDALRVEAECTVAALEAERSRARDAEAGAQDEIASLKSRQEGLERALESATARAEAAERQQREERIAVRQRLRAGEQQHASVKVRLEDELAQIRAAIATLESELRDARAEATSLASRAQALEVEIEEERARRVGAEEDVAGRDTELQALRQSEARLRADAASLASRVQALEVEIGDERARRLVTEEDIAERVAELQALRAELEAERLGRRRATADSAGAVLEAERLAEDVRRLRSDREELLAMLAGRDDQLAAFRRDLRAAADRSSAEPVPQPQPPVVQSSVPATGVDGADEVSQRAQFATRYADVVQQSPLTPDEVSLPNLISGTQRRRSATGPTVSVVVCVHNALDDVRRCLWALAAKTEREHELIVVDDGSDLDTARFLERTIAAYRNGRLISNPDPPHGYTIAANLGLRAAAGDYVVLLNSDTVVTSGWLDRLVECGESDPEIGILGPLSNAASHQSVPRVREDGRWAVNPLPDWLTPDGVAWTLRQVSRIERPRVPFVNGFCYVIRRQVIDAIGVFDEERFASGYAEENDYSVRAADAGFKLAVVDDAYVFHAKSRSYGTEGRSEPARRNYQVFLEKHGRERVEQMVRQLEAEPPVAALGARLEERLRAPERFSPEVTSLGRPLEIVFVLPGVSRGGSGGSHSIFQEVSAMRGLGVPAAIAVDARHMDRVDEAYPDAGDVFRPYADHADLAALTASADVIVSTHFKSVEQVAALRRERDFLAAYYVQDYEPFFSPPGSASEIEATASYTLIPDQLLFAKTHWLCNVVAAAHGVAVAKVEPSLDHEVFYPAAERREGDRLRIAAMIRPRTPRRQPALTVSVLNALRSRLGEAIDIVTFGCAVNDLQALPGGSSLRSDHRGILPRTAVADVLRCSDVFVDLSIYQAFGRTALEAMACGCVPVMPSVGGGREFIRPGINGVLVDTGAAEPFTSVAMDMAQDPQGRARMRSAGLETAARYSAPRAAVSEYVVLAEAVGRTALAASGSSPTG